MGGREVALATGWSFTGAYYHSTQNSWTTPAWGRPVPRTLVAARRGLLCAGDFDEASFVVDYAFNKHYDLYAGVNYSRVTDGLANGFLGTTKDGTTGSESQTTVMVGGRVRFWKAPRAAAIAKGSTEPPDVS